MVEPNLFRKSLLGVPVDVYRYDELLARIENGLEVKQRLKIFAINPEKIMASREDKELLAALESANILIPDGIGVVLGLRALCGISVNRVAGVSLFESLLEQANKKKLRVFIFGGTEEINKLAAEKISEKFPSINFIGRENGYTVAADYPGLVGKIESMNIDMLFVALGSPKQEKWVQEFCGDLKVGLIMGIGGSLDVISGRVKRAPRWVQNLYLEWLYRLFLDPRRIKRQMILPRYAIEVIKAKSLSFLKTKGRRKK